MSPPVTTWPRRNDSCARHSPRNARCPLRWPQHWTPGLIATPEPPSTRRSADCSTTADARRRHRGRAERFDRPTEPTSIAESHGHTFPTNHVASPLREPQRPFEHPSPTAMRCRHVEADAAFSRLPAFSPTLSPDWRDPEARVAVPSSVDGTSSVGDSQAGAADEAAPVKDGLRTVELREPDLRAATAWTYPSNQLTHCGGVSTSVPALPVRC